MKAASERSEQAATASSAVSYNSSLGSSGLRFMSNQRVAIQTVGPYSAEPIGSPERVSSVLLMDELAAPTALVEAVEVKRELIGSLLGLVRNLAFGLALKYLNPIRELRFLASKKGDSLYQASRACAKKLTRWDRIQRPGVAALGAPVAFEMIAKEKVAERFARFHSRASGLPNAM
jgi:hypothetical protein